MKAFWKNHPALRILLMLVLFVLSIALVTAGWKMTGQLAGLGIMLLGVALLLAVLAVYNAPYQDCPSSWNEARTSATASWTWPKYRVNIKWTARAITVSGKAAQELIPTESCTPGARNAGMRRKS